MKKKVSLENKCGEEWLESLRQKGTKKKALPKEMRKWIKKSARTIQRRKMKHFGHILRRSNCLRNMFEGEILETWTNRQVERVERREKAPPSYGDDDDVHVTALLQVVFHSEETCIIIYLTKSKGNEKNEFSN